MLMSLLGVIAVSLIVLAMVFHSARNVANAAKVRSEPTLSGSGFRIKRASHDAGIAKFLYGSGSTSRSITAAA